MFWAVDFLCDLALIVVIHCLWLLKHLEERESADLAEALVRSKTEMFHDSKDNALAALASASRLCTRASATSSGVA